MVVVRLLGVLTAVVVVVARSPTSGTTTTAPASSTSSATVGISASPAPARILHHRVAHVSTGGVRHGVRVRGSVGTTNRHVRWHASLHRIHSVRRATGYVLRAGYKLCVSRISWRHRHARVVGRWNVVWHVHRLLLLRWPLGLNGLLGLWLLGGLRLLLGTGLRYRLRCIVLWACLVIVVASGVARATARCWCGSVAAVRSRWDGACCLRLHVWCLELHVIHSIGIGIFVSHVGILRVYDWHHTCEDKTLQKRVSVRNSIMKKPKGQQQRITESFVHYK